MHQHAHHTHLLIAHLKNPICRFCFSKYSETDFLCTSTKLARLPLWTIQPSPHAKELVPDHHSFFSSHLKLPAVLLIESIIFNTSTSRAPQRIPLPCLMLRGTERESISPGQKVQEAAQHGEVQENDERFPCPCLQKSSHIVYEEGWGNTESMCVCQSACTKVTYRRATIHLVEYHVHYQPST